MLFGNPPIMLPYITLAMLVVGLFLIRPQKTIGILIAFQLLLAFAYGLIEPIGILAMVVFWGLCEFHWRRPAQKQWIGFVRFVFIMLFALAFANHIIPGFNNLKVFDTIQFSSLSSPFTMYLNIDKTMAAVILLASSRMLFINKHAFGYKSTFVCIKVAVLCVVTLMSLAMLSGYITYDPKLPEGAWLWMLNNLLFVCFAEEVIFRGMVQDHLTKFFHRCSIPSFVSIIIASFLFATTLLGHLQGGLSYIGFVIIAGLFYGYAYEKTQRLEAAMGVHFVMNLCHFLLFTYPMVV